VAVPAFIPVTTPVESIVATEEVLLVHTPPPVTQDSAVLASLHTISVPVIESTTGKELTVITAVVLL
jgi:hypothetical protein